MDIAGQAFFQGAEQEARKIEQPGVFGLLAVAFSQVGLDQLQDAAATYRQIGKIDEQGASYMAAGLGDLAVYEGRFAEAVRILEPAAAAISDAYPRPHAAGISV